MKKIYAVAKGRQTGLFTTWAECAKSVNGFVNAKYKGFADTDSARAWLAENLVNIPANAVSPKHSVAETKDNDEDAADFIVYTDGSCLKNPGAGGWATVIIDKATGEITEMSDGEKLTTNNRMEMSAAINALERTPEGANILLYTDSQYLKNAFTKYWLRNWKRNGWKTSAGEAVKNRELWQKLDKLTAARQIKFRWVKGHAGNKFNERCDELARNEAAKLN